MRMLFFRAFCLRQSQQKKKLRSNRFIFVEYMDKFIITCTNPSPNAIVNLRCCCEVATCNYPIFFGNTQKKLMNFNMHIY